MSMFHGLDLWADLGGPRLSWRRLRVLLSHLPDEAACTAPDEPGENRWGLTQLLLAEIVDVQRLRIWQAGDPKKSPKPKPIPRPGVKAEPVRKRMDPEQVRTRLRQLAEQRANARGGD